MPASSFVCQSIRNGRCAEALGKLRYLPSRTYSSHYIRDPNLRGAVANFLRRERAQIEYTIETLTAYESPYKAAKDPK